MGMAKFAKKQLTSGVGLCYSMGAMEEVFFFMPIFKGIAERKTKVEVESCARKDHIGMYRMSAEKLQYDERQENTS